MIKITDENRADLIASCLMEAANIMKENNNKPMEESIEIHNGEVKPRKSTTDIIDQLQGDEKVKAQKIVDDVVAAIKNPKKSGKNNKVKEAMGESVENHLGFADTLLEALDNPEILEERIVDRYNKDLAILGQSYANQRLDRLKDAANKPKSIKEKLNFIDRINEVKNINKAKNEVEFVRLKNILDKLEDDADKAESAKEKVDLINKIDKVKKEMKHIKH